MALLSESQGQTSVHIPKPLKKLINSVCPIRIQTIFGSYNKPSISMYIQYLIMRDLEDHGLISDDDKTALNEDQLRFLK